MSPWCLVSPCHKSRGDPRLRTRLQSGQPIVREDGEHTMMRLLAAVLSPRNTFLLDED